MANFKKFGPWFSYEGSPRAQIFKRDHNKVVDMDSMMKLMRYGRDLIIHSGLTLHFSRILS